MVTVQDINTLVTQFSDERDTALAGKDSIILAQSGIISAQNGTIANLRAQIAAILKNRLLVGARVQDISWDQAVAEIGQPKVTRLFYRQLPKTYTRGVLPKGVLLIVSFKDPVTNVKSYVSSIPAGELVQMAFHHESEKDYGVDGGPKYLAEFATARSNVKAANPDMPVAKIAGGYQYGSPKRNGWDGSYIPPNADRYYMDTYQRGPGLTAAEATPSVQRYLKLLTDMGKDFNGFTEYGRGAIPFGQSLDPSIPAQREALFPIDAAWLLSLPAVQVWCYWYTTDGADPNNPRPDQWRMLDERSQAAWRALQA